MIKLDTWITQFGVWTQKLCKLQVSDSCCAEAVGRPASPRPAGLTPLQNTSYLATRPLGTLQWTPTYWIYKQIQKLWLKGLAHGLKDPFAALTEISWPGAPLWTSCSVWSRRWWNGGPRSANSRPADLQFSALNHCNLHRHLDKIRSVHEKGGCKQRKSQADRPKRGRLAPLAAS